MKIIQRPIRGGKTTKLIQLAAQGRYKLIVCGSLVEAHQIFKSAQDLGLNIPMPITYNELIRRKYAGKNIESFLFDNVDLFLQTLTSVKIEAISVTGESL